MITGRLHGNAPMLQNAPSYPPGPYVIMEMLRDASSLSQCFRIARHPGNRLRTLRHNNSASGHLIIFIKTLRHHFNAPRCPVIVAMLQDAVILAGGPPMVTVGRIRTGRRSQFGRLEKN